PDQLLDCNDCIFSGWYRVINNAANAPFFGGAWLRVDMYDEKYGVQTWYREAMTGTTHGVSAQRFLNRGVWQPWEYINPPMQLGVEYRTTERYNGKPVYCRWIDLANLATHGTREYQLTPDSNPVEIAYWKVTSGDPDGNVFDVDCASWASVRFKPTENKMTVTLDTTLTGAHWASALLKYTKT
ncbi:MAG: hypothetical protein J6U82_06760, partial [Alistipes sp.]|nr:hypothetical protein [Alistipes sp.]